MPSGFIDIFIFYQLNTSNAKIQQIYAHESVIKDGNLIRIVVLIQKDSQLEDHI